MRIAVIGAGYWGKNLVRNYGELGVLHGICDASADVATRYSENDSSLKVATEPREFLDDSNVDAIAIATPAATHGALVADALSTGKHVFVEKPLCLDLDEARRLKDQAEEKGLTLMVGHMLHYHPAFCALRDVVAEGGIGELRYIYSTRLSLGKIRREENALWSFAPHDISMILALTGKMPELVSAKGEAYLREGVADTTLSHMTFTNRLQAHIFVSWIHPFKDQRLVVSGSNGMLVFDDVRPGDEKLLLYRHQVGWDGDIPTVNKAESEAVAYGDEEPLRAECRHFISCVESGTRPDTDAAEGIRVLSVLDACQRSLMSGNSINPDMDI